MGYINRQQFLAVMVLLGCLLLFPSLTTQAEEPMSLKLSYSAHNTGTRQEIGIGTVALVITLGLDHELADLLQIDESNKAALWIAEETSQFAEAGLVLGHVILYSQNQELAWQSAKAVAVTSVAVLSLKTLLGRARPEVGDGQGKYYGLNFSNNYHSMPSGHTAAAFAMARVMAKDDPKHAYAYYAVAALFGLSRVQLKQHWPSDVVAGALLGYTIGGFF